MIRKLFTCILALTILYVISSNFAIASDINSIFDRRIALVEKDGFNGIYKSIQNNEPWPNIIESDKTIKNIEVLREKEDKLCILLLESIDKWQTKDDVDNIKGLKALLLKLVVVRKAMEKNISFVNALMIDSINRIMIARIGCWLLKHPSHAKIIASTIDSLPYDINLKAWLELSKKAGYTITEGNENDDNSAYKSLFKEICKKRIDKGNSSRLATKSSDILSTKDLCSLYFRTLDTIAISRVSLPALVTYMQRNGKVKNLTKYMVADATEFRKILGSEREKYSFKIAGIHKVQVVHLLSLSNILKKDYSESSIYQSAIK